MPVRRRNAKRREQNLAWDVVFRSGHDFFGDLAEAGIETDEYDTPDRAQLEGAWSRYGADFLARYNDPPHEPWALRELGEP